MAIKDLCVCVFWFSDQDGIPEWWGVEDCNKGAPTHITTLDSGQPIPRLQVPDDYSLSSLTKQHANNERQMTCIQQTTSEGQTSGEPMNEQMVLSVTSIVKQDT